MSRAPESAIALFDFDGTVTRRDSMFRFFRFTHGFFPLLFSVLRLAPVLVGFRLGFVSNQSAKERFLTYFYAGWDVERLTELGDRFATSRLPAMTRPGAMKRIQWHLDKAHTVVIVSASAEVWLRSWCVGTGVELLASRMGNAEGVVTGRLEGLNCHGQEKVRRIKSRYELERYAKVYAYGDSSGDRPMLELADESYYRPFRGGRMSSEDEYHES